MRYDTLKACTGEDQGISFLLIIKKSEQMYTHNFYKAYSTDCSIVDCEIVL